MGLTGLLATGFFTISTGGLSSPKVYYCANFAMKHSSDALDRFDA